MIFLLLNRIGNHMEYKVIIQGKFPSLNEYVNACRSNRNQGNSMKKKSQKEITAYIRSQLAVHITKPVFIEYHFYEANKRRDLDNISGYFHKVFQDSLVYCNVLTDDGWSYVVGFTDTFSICGINPRIEIIIREVEE